MFIPMMCFAYNKQYLSFFKPKAEIPDKSHKWRFIDKMK